MKGPCERSDKSRWDKGTAEFTRDGNRKLLLLVSIVVLIVLACLLS